MTEEQITKIWVGQAPTTLNGPVALADYDPNWHRQFLKESKRIRSALGAKALMVEHVGSTSVPGLEAKPVVDILLVVVNSADEKSYIASLEAAGYVLRIREPGWHEHRLFKGPETDINLHVFSEGDGEVDRMLVFRDRLRAHPGDRDLYLRTKRKLARKKWRYVQNYADSKSKVVESIIARGRASRKASNNRRKLTA
jgi:GrpB-like predicted nucleotidyltransferase (UPF0157 family)